MKKIPTLFKRDYSKKVNGSYLVYDEVNPGCEWVLNGEGKATIKIDGTCCMIKDGELYKRYDRKLNKRANKIKKSNPDFKPTIEDFKEAPKGFIPCEESFDPVTFHWPGWVKVDKNKPEDKYHIEAFKKLKKNTYLCEGTCELIGPKIQGNPYCHEGHLLVHHSENTIRLMGNGFEYLKFELMISPLEGIVFHHPDGKMCKIKRTDFGFEWPIKNRVV